MKKIPTLFLRDPQDMSQVTDEVNPECQWVLDGMGTATRKYDGTCVMLDEEGEWWARREVKPGKTPPPGWVEADHDEATGKRPGWEPIAQSPFRKAWEEALRREEWVVETVSSAPGTPRLTIEPGTYELVGPKVNGNPEGYVVHRLMRHADAETFGMTDGGPRSGPAIRALVLAVGRDGWEGLVWHHSDGRMAKLKAKDIKEDR